MRIGGATGEAARKPLEQGNRGSVTVVHTRIPNGKAEKAIKKFCVTNSETKPNKSIRAQLPGTLPLRAFG